MSGWRWRRMAVAGVAGVACVAAAGCGESRSAAGVQGPYAKDVAEAMPKVERATGLRFKRAPTVESRTRAQVRAFLERKFNDELPQKELAGIERAYKRLGVIPESMALRPYLLNLLGEQVAGFYDPGTKTLYVVEGASDAMLAATLNHELVHALQDQYVNLDSIQKIEGDNDRQSAAQAVIEGQAQLESMKIVLGTGDIASRLPGGWDRVRETIRENQASMPIFANAPMFLQETLLFPYLSGAEFMRQFESRRPGRVPYDSMPLSTEQILHVDAYFPRRAAAPRLVLPPLGGVTDAYENDLGEFEMRLFLYQHLQDQSAAARGAAGWNGDRYVVFRAGGGDAIAWASTWDSAVDAAEFHDLLDKVITKRFPGASARGSGTSKRYDAAGRSIAISTALVGGRPAVLYVDVPAGARTDVFELTRVQVR